MNKPIVAGVGVNDPRSSSRRPHTKVFTPRPTSLPRTRSRACRWVADYESGTIRNPATRRGRCTTRSIDAECIKSTPGLPERLKSARVKLRDCWRT